jgi:rare lipoprotein A
MRGVTPAPAAKVSTVPSAKAPVAQNSAKVSVAPQETASAAPLVKARFVQISAFFVEDQATRAAARFDNLGAHVFRGVVDGKPVFRVRLGPFPSLSDAKSALAAAQMAGQADAMLVTDAVEGQSPKAPSPPTVRTAPSLRMSQNGGKTQE